MDGTLTGVGVLVADLITAEGAIDDWSQALVKVRCAVEQIMIVLALKVLIRAHGRLGAVTRALQPRRVFAGSAACDLLNRDQLVPI